ncbi:mitochondrial carrier [Parathielavia hyrcaniae]|uniref:Mitochondrial carrier n=1 Tax=Parathielavia hyrcaniae TaxID=113614 RepID=A0AAN6Q8F0_9PEZI|nr:mitochondrial carrier [Parathielavia hyrcaniae]
MEPASTLDPLSQAATAPMQLNSRTAVAEAVEDILYGSIAGVVGKYIEYPFDTVKVRLQSQPDHLPLQYKGPVDCFRQSIRADGVLGLYRGISAPLVGAALENSSLFFWERLGRAAIYASGYAPRELPLPLSALWLTGAFSGAMTSLVLTPVELIKCKIQVPAANAGDGAVGAPLKPAAVIKDIWRHQGWRGFWHGQLGTLIRESGGCAAWFGSKETVSKLFREWNERRARTEEERERVRAADADVDALPLWQQAVAGASAGMSYNFLFFPADTVKSRMQTTPIGESAAPQRTFAREASALWKQAGLKGFYRGCGITVLRSVPSSAFIFMVYDGLKKYFPMQ